MSIRLLDVVVVLGGASLMVTLILMFAANGPSPEVETDAAEPNRRSVARTIDAARHARQKGIHWPYLTIERGTFDDGHRGDVRVTIYGVTLAFDANDDVAIRQHPSPLVLERRGIDEAIHFSLKQVLENPDVWKEQVARVVPDDPFFVKLCGQWDVSFEGKLAWRETIFGVRSRDLPWGMTHYTQCRRRALADLIVHPGTLSETRANRRYRKFFNHWDLFKEQIADGDYVRVPGLRAGFQQYISKYDLDDYKAGDRSMGHSYYHPPNPLTGDGILLGCAHSYDGTKIIACGYNGATDDERVEWDTQFRPHIGPAEKPERPERWLQLARAVQQVVDNVLVSYDRADLLQDEAR